MEVYPPTDLCPLLSASQLHPYSAEESMSLKNLPLCHQIFKWVGCGPPLFLCVQEMFFFFSHPFIDLLVPASLGVGGSLVR